MKNGTESQEISLEQTGTLAGFITSFLVKGLSAEQVLYWLGHKTELKQNLRKIFEVDDDGYATLRKNWQKFYKDQFKWDVDFSGVIIPSKPSIGIWRLLIVAQNMTCNRVFARWEILFNCWRYWDDMDTARTAEKHYAVWVLDSVEPDAEFLGKSTEEADSDMEIGVTLLERLLQELKYFSETGNHLDITGLTYCSGSRDADGKVPCVYYFLHDGSVKVNWSGVGDSGEEYGIRRVVRS